MLLRRKQAKAEHRDSRDANGSIPLFVNEPIPQDFSLMTTTSGSRPATTAQRPDPPGAAASIFDAEVPSFEVSEPTQGQPKTRPVKRRDNTWRLIGIGLLAVVAVFAFTRATAPDDDAGEGQAAPVASTTTSGAPVAVPAVTTLPPIATTAAPVLVQTTLPPTTTTSSTSTTNPPTTTTEPLPFVAVVGDPLPIEQLTLSVLGIGPLDFGDSAEAVLGRLAASFGQPDFDSGAVTGGEYGTCTEGTFRVVSWGSLAVTTRFAGGAETFDSFRVDLRDFEFPGPAAALQTLSGFTAGATVAELEATYVPGFRIEYRTHPVEGNVYELSSNQGLVLWGPVSTSAADGLVLGIFSPSTC